MLNALEKSITLKIILTRKGRNIMEENEEEMNSLKEELMRKLEQEMFEYKESLKEKAPDEIMQNAYELTIKQEIIDFYNYDLGYTKEDLETLIKEPNLLEQGYDEWLSFDGNLREVIEYPIEHLNEIIKEENEKNPNHDIRYSEEKKPKNEVR